MAKLDDLAARDQEIWNLEAAQRPQDLDGPEARRRLALALAKRGNLKMRIGFSASAVLDLLRAQAQYADLSQDQGPSSRQQLLAEFDDNVKVPAPFTLNAQLGEALRLEARDVFLSSASGGAAFEDNIQRCVKCFTRALKDLQLAANQTDDSGPNLDFGKASEFKAWILAHRGAALTSRIWLNLVGGKPVALLYPQAEQDLREALGVHPTYAWGRRFLAVLLTLRSGEKDLANATKLLDTSDSVDPSQQSSLQRSRALLSYMAANSADATPEEKRKAACDAVEKSVAAANNDPDDFMGVYIGAASLASLYESYASDPPGGDKDLNRRVVNKENVSAAIDSAVVHAQNALSQATACLIGALKLRQKLGNAGTEQSNGSDAKTIQLLTTIFKTSQMDLETAAIILRDPNLADLRGSSDSTENKPPIANFGTDYGLPERPTILTME